MNFYVQICSERVCIFSKCFSLFNSALRVHLEGEILRCKSLLGLFVFLAFNSNIDEYLGVHPFVHIVDILITSSRLFLIFYRTHITSVCFNLKKYIYLISIFFLVSFHPLFLKK